MTDTTCLHVWGPRTGPGRLTALSTARGWAETVCVVCGVGCGIDLYPVPTLAEEVAAEGRRAAVLHGEPEDRPGLHWLAILAEEFGEVAQEVTKGEVPPVNRPPEVYLPNLRAELVQVASVAMRWCAAVDRQIIAAHYEREPKERT